MEVCITTTNIEPGIDSEPQTAVDKRLQTAVDKRWDRGAAFLGRETRANMQSPYVSTEKRRATFLHLVNGCLKFTGYALLENLKQLCEIQRYTFKTVTASLRVLL
ncbi:hypothetical protein Y032_0045g1098 [Ancylostoma ceylanicum]|nr:hypothetical protein Y032_0045g1098 [Ancylostoma ceylanicum]